MDTGGSSQRPVLKSKSYKPAGTIKKEGKWTTECPPKKMQHKKLELVGSIKGKTNKVYDRVFPRGVIKISKEKNRGYSRENTGGK